MEFLSVREVAKRYNVGVSTVWAWVRGGSFPSPVNLTRGCTRWRMVDLLEWETGKEAKEA